MHYIVTKINFFPGGYAPRPPLSYNMSDVNPHLTRCEPPPYLKAGSALQTAVFQHSFKEILNSDPILEYHDPNKDSKISRPQTFSE